MTNPIFSNNPQFQPGGARPMGMGGNTLTSPAFGQPARSGQGSMYGQGMPGMGGPDLQELYDMPAAGPAQTGRLTYDDVIMKTLMCFALVLVGAGVGWVFPGVGMVGAIVGLVLGLVNAFKREPSPGLILAYAAAQGLFLGALSVLMETRYSGIVVQAVLATFSVFAVSLWAYKSGKIRMTGKTMRILMIAMGAYLVFSLLNLGLMLFGGMDGFGLRSMPIPGTNIPLGLVIGLFAVALGAFSLIMDFQFVDEGVKNGVPAKYAWTAAFGITMTMIWLYTEILRLLAILRGDD